MKVHLCTHTPIFPKVPPIPHESPNLLHVPLGDSPIGERHFLHLSKASY